MKAYVVEDKEVLRKGIIDQIGRVLPEVRVIGSSGTVIQAAKEIRALEPSVLFLDIDLPDGDAFDLLDISPGSYYVIFITGNAQYAIQAYQYAAVHYILKPIKDEDLLEAFARMNESGRMLPEQVGIARSLASESSIPKRIALHTADKIVYVNLPDIVRCEADGNYTRFILDGATVLVAKTLKDYSLLLEKGHFLRVHQSHLVNVQRIREYVKTDGGYLVMDDGKKVPVATRKRSAVLAALNDIFPG